MSVDGGTKTEIPNDDIMPPDCRTSYLARESPSARWPLVASVTLVAALAAALTSAAAQRSPQSATSENIQVPSGESVVSLLDTVINWYRDTDVEPQLVEKPVEVLFVAQDRELAADILKLAFQYARADATALAASRINHRGGPPGAAAGDLLAQPESIKRRSADIEAEIPRLQDQVRKLQKQIAVTPKLKRDILIDQLTNAQGQLELAQARRDFLSAMSQFEAGDEVHHANPSGTLLGQIDELESTVPAAATSVAPPPSSGGTFSKPASEPSGLIPHAKAWFAVRAKVNRIQQRIQSTARLNQMVDQTANILRQDLTVLDKQVRALAGPGGAEGGASAASIEARKAQFESLLARHKQIGDALLPLRETSVLLGRGRSNLSAWQADAEQGAGAQLHGLVLGAIGLAVVLGLLMAAGAAWRRIVFHYVTDVRRRNQMLQVRSVVIGFLALIVLALEFVSEAGSLATVIGLATAGLAVALQDVILSLAGYFRMGGRFGIKVGDWVELHGVRGEVIDIGPTKLTMLELAAENGTREPTGRLVVIPNSAVFREKFANRTHDTSLAWDEIELTVSPDCDYRLAEKRMLEAVEERFAHYRDAARIESRTLERRFNLRMEPPRPQSRLKIASDAIRLNVRYPVDARVRARVADEISRRILEMLKAEPTIRLAPSAAAAILPANSDQAGVAPQAREKSQPTPAAS